MNELPQTSFQTVGVKERDDLQRLLKSQIDVVGDDLLVISEEFGDWDDSRRRIDLLAVDKDANIVVIELKRTDDGGYMDLQAIRYAAMVSTMTFEKAVEVYTEFGRKEGLQIDAEANLLEFLNWDEPQEDEFAQDVRIVLVSANFSKELTTSVIWLNTRDLDIRCIRIVPYDDGGRTLVDVQQLIPLPGAEEYQVQIREKQRTERRTRTKNQELLRKFGKSLFEVARSRLSDPDPLRFHKESGHWMSVGISGLYLGFAVTMKSVRSQLYIDSRDTEKNLGTFDLLHGHKEQIETAFGGPLSWERLNSKRACRICYRLEDAGYGSPEEEWEAIQTELSDALERLANALGPFLPEVKNI